jgi:hypothetical protein
MLNAVCLLVMPQWEEEMPIPSSFYYAECLLGIALSLSHQVQFYTLVSRLESVSFTVSLKKYSFLTIFAEGVHSLEKGTRHGCNITLKRQGKKLANAHFCEK